MEYLASQETSIVGEKVIASLKDLLDNNLSYFKEKFSFNEKT